MVGSSSHVAKLQQPRVAIAALTLFCVLIWILSLHYHSDDSLPNAHNSTLGFGATILISLPERTDRRDAISLIASTTGVSITHTVSAVRGEDVKGKGRPFGKAVEALDNPHWGSWRSHLDAFKYVVDNRIETALILEDDVDWAQSIKMQMGSLSKAMTSNSIEGLRNPRSSSRTPYGEGWDLLHLGISNLTIPPQLPDKGVITYSDPTLPPGAYRDMDCHKGKPWYCFSNSLKQLDAPNQSRAVVSSCGPIGLVALAVTLSGAQKLLYLLSWKGLDDGVDWSIRDYVKGGQLSGMTVVPPLFGTWTTGYGDSDIRVGAPSRSGDNLKGRPRGVRDSARQHLKDLMGR